MVLVLLQVYPAKYVDNFINSNASLIVFHYEAVAEDKINELIAHIKEHDVEVGLSLNVHQDTYPLLY